MNNQLKKIIFNKLYEDLRKLEIIEHYNSIWFIDREKKYWYFEYSMSGTLYWRYDFFPSFFLLFSLDVREYEPIIQEWVEEVLSCLINISQMNSNTLTCMVEDVLNHKINETRYSMNPMLLPVEKILNHNIKTTKRGLAGDLLIENILTFKVLSTTHYHFFNCSKVEEVLSSQSPK